MSDTISEKRRLRYQWELDGLEVNSDGDEVRKKIVPLCKKFLRHRLTPEIIRLIDIATRRQSEGLLLDELLRREKKAILQLLEEASSALINKRTTHFIKRAEARIKDVDLYKVYIDEQPIAAFTAFHRIGIKKLRKRGHSFYMSFLLRSFITEWKKMLDTGDSLPYFKVKKNERSISTKCLCALVYKHWDIFDATIGMLSNERLRNFFLCMSHVIKEKSQEASMLVPDVTKGQIGQMEYMIFALIAHNTGDYETAITCCLKISRQKGNEWVSIILASSYRQTGKIQKALKAFSHCHKLNDGDQARYERIQALIKAGKLEEAYHCATEIFGNGRKKRGIVAEILRKQKKYEESIEMLDPIAEKSYKMLLCEAYSFLHAKKHIECYASLKEAQKIIENNQKKDSTQYDKRSVRLHAAFIFLFGDIHHDESFPQHFEIMEQACDSYEILQNIPVEGLSRKQTKKRQNALRIIENIIAKSTPVE